ncbi:hypothetical protein [Paenibacillus dakarensis]|uniref:hypothetical protein n=1 Tax=Paenibacillus dakarensis TaxID=1527293 RepID=UPI0006D53EF6|nr:hypothetical protein [Paenibacillus dakarensis]
MERKQQQDRVPWWSLERSAGLSLLAGGLLLGISTAMHPPAANPWSGLEAIHIIHEGTFYWQIDHSLMLLAVLLWFSGLSAGETYAGAGPTARLAARFFAAALTIWVIILAMEMTILPTAVHYIGLDREPAAQGILIGIYAFGIMVGDFAMALAWIGVSLTALALFKEKNSFPRWLSTAGIWAGIWGVAGIIAALLLPDYSLPIYLVSAGPPYVWTLLFGWRMMRSGKSDV